MTKGWLVLILATAVSFPAFAQSEPAPDEPAPVEGAPDEQADEAPPVEGAPVEGEETATHDAPAGEGDAAQPAPEDPRLVEARERIAQAEGFYDREDYDAALAEFESTFELLRGHNMRFLVLFNIGRCQEKLFRYQDAMVSFRAFLSEGGEFSEQAPDVRAKIELLDGLLGTVTLTVDTADYEVWVSDRLIGNGLTELLLPSGTHSIEIRKLGFVANQQQVQVVARSTAELSFEMARLAEQAEGLSPAIFVTATAATVVALGVGAAFGGLALSRSNAIGERNPSLATQEEADEVRRFSRTADVMFGVALLGATSAVIFALFTDWGGDEEESARLRIDPAVGDGQAGLIVRGAF